ncbi:MAG: type I-U CRISPR-associated protein Csx17 [Euryarchaeota archaeon]|nr:type I-U CRISPR-associated protein Csx17 [Euryarchaeota archaeon]
MNEIPIPLLGLTPTPLGNYLAALGVLKAVSKKWPEARGFWRDDIFHLRGPFGVDDIVKYLAEEWEPTPFIRPWNPDEVEDKKTLDSVPSKFETTRNGLRFSIDQIAQSEKLKTAKNKLKERKDFLNEKGGSKREKQMRIKADETISKLNLSIKEIEKSFSPNLHRDKSPEATVSVIDATLQTLTETKQDRINAPLLGTGGNDGKRDFMRVWMIQIQAIYSPGQIEQSKNWLAHALGVEMNICSPLSEISGNSWFPDAIKIHNSGQQGYYTEHPSNPWLYVLACEGVCILSGSSSRRLGVHAQPSAIFPFVTNPESPYNKATVGHVSAEFWAPIWHKPVTLTEIAGVFRRGRASFSGRSATYPHRMAEAIIAQGTEHGVMAFERHSLSQTTSANTFEALPTGRFKVRQDMVGASQCLAELTTWEDKLPRDSAKIVLGLRRAFEDAVLSVTAEPDDYVTWQHLLITCAEIHRRVDQNKDFRKSCRPVPPLSLRWLKFLDDGSEEFELAAAVASIRGNRNGEEGCGPLRGNIFSVDIFERAQFAPGQPDNSWASFTKSPSNRVVWSGMNLIHDMNEVLRRRSVDSPLTSSLALGGRVMCSPSSLALFLDGQLDDARISKLIPAISLLNWNDQRVEPYNLMAERRGSHNNERNALYTLPRPYLLMKLLFQPYNFITRKYDGLKVRAFGGNRKFPPRAPQALAALMAGDLNRAVSEVTTRLRACGLSPVKMEIPTQSSDYCERIAAALLVPLSTFYMSQSIDMICNPKMEDKNK